MLLKNNQVLKLTSKRESGLFPIRNCQYKDIETILSQSVQDAVQNAIDWVAYKQRTFISHSSGD